jgi:N-acetyl-anhydromuramyl-L-alanine amidase AmpD
MTSEEVYDYINKQDWSEVEKQEVRRLYRAYTVMTGRPQNSSMHEKAEKFEKQLAEYGIFF